MSGKNSKIISDFVNISEFNIISKSKEIVSESVALHAKIKKIINSYKSYMDANNYNYSSFMINIEKVCDEYEEFLNSFNTTEKQETLED